MTVLALLLLVAIGGLSGAVLSSLRLTRTTEESTLADEATPLVPLRGSRRERRSTAGRGDSGWFAVDGAHAKGSMLAVDAGATGTSDDGLLEQLSRQLDLLEGQQRQIRRLLEATERRASSRDLRALDA